MRAAIALGSNLPSRFGGPADNLREALQRLGELGSITAVSSFYATAPVGYLDQPEFVNATCVLETELGPLELLRAMLGIELAMGRNRAGAVPKGPRVIDLDLLIYGSLELHDPELVLPHPAMHERRFVLEPLAEIAGDWAVPGVGATVAELLSLTEAPVTRTSSRWFWIVTAASLFVATLFIAYLYAILRALGAFAAGVVTWPLELLLPFGVSLTVAGFVLTRRVPIRWKRRFGYVLNSLPLSFYALILTGFLILSIRVERRLFVVTEGYQGFILVIHSQKHGIAPSKGLFRTTYRVPVDGVLVTSAPPVESFFSDSFEYALPNGKTMALRPFELGVAEDAVENRKDHRVYASDQSVGVNYQTSDGCHLTYDEFFVGTKASKLMGLPAKSVDDITKAHRELCSSLPVH